MEEEPGIPAVSGPCVGAGKEPCMIIDFHTHIFPPEVVNDRERFVKRDAVFALVYENPKARMVTVEGHLEAMARDGVDAAVVCGFPWADPGLAETANAYVLDAQRRFPERVHAFYTPPLSGGDGALRGAQDALDQGMKGIGEAAFYREEMLEEDWRHLGELARVAQGFGRPLLLHVNEPVGHVYPGKVQMRLRDVWRFVSDVPDLTLVLAHWGGGLFFYELMKSVRRSVGNLHYDTAASPFLYDPSIYRIATEILGPGRVLFGSDYPLIPPSRYFAEIDRAGLAPEARAALLGGNARKLLQL